jgi:hypothetical protein
MKSIRTLAIVLGMLVVHRPEVVSAQPSSQDLRAWGLEVHAEIDETLRVPGTSLYAETASLSGARSGGLNGRAFVWPAATQFRVLNSLVKHDPATYAATLRSFSDELRAAYWDVGYRSGAGGGDRFYDDNAHLVVSLAEAHQLTGDPVYLARAIETYSFVLQGEDAAAGGGIYFQQYNNFSKDAISTLQGARGAAMLYKATANQQYLNDAVRLLTWAESKIQQSDGLFSQGFVISTNSPAGVAIVNAAGIGISANLELFDATGEGSYLTEARRIAGRSINRYFDSATGRINDEGFWAFELVDALNDLYLRDRMPLWRNKVRTALEWLHENKEDPNGHYGLFWGRNGPQVGALSSWSLNEQASVARAYLDSALTSLPGDVNQDGVISVADVEDFIVSWRTDTSALPTLEKLRAGDLDLDGFTGLSDAYLLRNALRRAGVTYPPGGIGSLGVPEPATSALCFTSAAFIGLFCTRRTRA